MGKHKVGAVFLAGVLAMGTVMTGCSGKDETEGKTVIEMVQYKPEAVDIFEQFQDEFNATHDDIYLKIDSPNDAMTILKTRFIREDNPDIIGIGGDINYSNFLDADMLMDISDFEGLNDIKEKYLEMNKDLEYVPKDGVYAVPYMANAAGILFNRDMFEEHGWEVPTTWTEFTNLCDQIQSEGIQPLYFGFKDTWTTLAPWNAIAVSLCDSDLTYQVNSGETTFAENYREVAEKEKALLAYGQKDPVVEYKTRAFKMFNDMIGSIQEDTVRMLYHVHVEQKIEREQVAKVTGTNKDDTSVKKPVQRKEDKVYPNDPCPCGSGKKYKQCCGRKLMKA